MNSVTNPYSPGAGARPAALTGRDDVLTAWETSLQRVSRERIDQPLILHGLRGMGKTVLLAEFRRRALKRNWLVAKAEASIGSKLRDLLGESLYEPLLEISRPSAGKRALQALKTALSFKASYDMTGAWSFGVDLSDSTGGGADTGDLNTDIRLVIRDVSAAAGEDNVGLAVLIDEAQDLSTEDLTTLCAVAHEAVQSGWPVLIALAGLPSLPQILAEAKSYAERFRYMQITSLDEAAAIDALQDPAAEEDVEWERYALAAAVEGAGRYPFFLQQIGHETWEAAPKSPITVADVEVGIARGSAALDNGFFRVRWDRATPGERSYLRAMKLAGNATIASSEVASSLGKKAAQVSTVRDRLISKGLIYAPEHGLLAYTVPGMAAFIDRQTLE